MSVLATEVSVKRELTVSLISSLCSKFHWYGKSFFKREPTTSGCVAQFKMKKRKTKNLLSHVYARFSNRNGPSQL